MICPDSEGYAGSGGKRVNHRARPIPPRMQYIREEKSAYKGDAYYFISSHGYL